MNAVLLSIALVFFITAISIALYSQKKESMTDVKLEMWNKSGRLLDYSYAGKQGGIMKIEKYNYNMMTDFGAKGDGITDDTKAFKKAFEDANGVLYIPAGKYIIQGILKRTKPLIINGAGEDKTILYFPKSMRELYGRANDNNKWSFGPCFIQFENKNDDVQLCKIVRDASFGDKVVYVNSTNGLEKGKWVKIALKDSREGDLFKIVYSKDMSMIPKMELGQHTMEISNKVKNISGNKVEFERPFPIDISLTCSPIIKTFSNFDSVYGIQNLTFEAKYEKYAGHLNEDGYNMLNYSNIVNGWVRNIKFINVDIGVKLSFCHFTTVDKTLFESSNDRMGHHALWIAGGADNLVQNFTIDNKFTHDLSIQSLTACNVFANGYVKDMNIDHHKVGPYGNLFTNLHIGKGTRMFDSGGKPPRGGYAASSTFWNIMKNDCTQKTTATCRKIELPKNERYTYGNKTTRPFGSNLNFIGIFNTEPSNDGWYIESYPNIQSLTPSNLHEAMVQKRQT